MKSINKLAVIIAAALLCAFSFAACIKGGGEDGTGKPPDNPPGKQISVTFISGGEIYQTVEVKPGTAMPENPQKEGYLFDGWYFEVEFRRAFTGFSDIPDGADSVSVYAKWVPGPSVSAAGAFIALAAAADAFLPMPMYRDKVVAARSSYDGLSADAKNIAGVAEALTALEAEEKKLADATVVLFVLGASTTMCLPAIPYATAGMRPYDSTMIGSRLWAEAEAVKTAVSAMGENHYVGIISFATTATQRLELTGVTRVGAAVLINDAINGIATTQGRVYGAATAAAQTFMDEIIPTCKRHIIFMNCMGPYPAEADRAFLEPIKAMAADGVTLSAMGVFDSGIAEADKSAASDVYAEMAKSGNGVFYPVNVSGGSVLKGTVLGELGRLKSSQQLDPETAVIPGGTASIRDFEFAGWGRLKSVTIPSSVTSIGDFAFWGCESLESITLPDGLRSIGEYAFWGCRSLLSLTVPSGVESVNLGAFMGCDGLTGLILPFVGSGPKWTTSNTNFGYIFGETNYNNQNSSVPASLKSVTVTGGSIRDYAFYGCASITDITINGAISIGYCVFFNCSSLINITISDSVSEIGGMSFEGCTKLEYETVAGIRYLSNWAVGPTAADQDMLHAALKDTTRGICPEAFMGCRFLERVTFPDSVEFIGINAFESCSQLKSVTLPEGLKYIGQGAFLITGIISIVIPASVTLIGLDAFNFDLQAVYYGGTGAGAWDAIAKAQNPGLENATVYYYSEAPVADGRHWHYDPATDLPAVWP
ncbi:MAG: leucine-rich repeat protein [Firmicutes bacterium]|nr:leucine-rich repeat protein [Bacillota bacterium]